MGFAALNAAAHQGKQNRVRETLEAQESRIADTYAAGLRLAEEGRRSEALVSLISSTICVLCGRPTLLECCLTVAPMLFTRANTTVPHTQQEQIYSVTRLILLTP